MCVTVTVLQRRFIPGPALDEPIVWYEGSSTSDRRWFAADERGSVIAVLNSSGAASTINTYDEYGLRGSSNAGRFQFTGQPWVPEVSLYHYRARTYSPSLGRFMQTDPILHAGGMNLYSYVGNDPINRSDPFGLLDEEEEEEVVVTGHCEPCRRRREAQEWLRQLQDQPGFRTPWDLLDTDGDGVIEPQEATDDKRLCAGAQAQLAGLNQQIAGWNRQLNTVRGAAAATGAVLGAERTGRQVDTLRGGRIQNAMGPDRSYLGQDAGAWTSEARAAFGIGRYVGAAYVGVSTLGPAHQMYGQAIAALNQRRRDMELAMAAAGCAVGSGGG